MTEPATRTLGRIATQTGRHLPHRVTPGGGCEFRSSGGHWAGAIEPDGAAEVVDLSDGHPGTRTKYLPDGTPVLE